MKSKRLFYALSAVLLTVVFLMVSWVSPVLATENNLPESPVQDTSSLLNRSSEDAAPRNAPAILPVALQDGSESEGSQVASSPGEDAPAVPPADEKDLSSATSESSVSSEAPQESEGSADSSNDNAVSSGAPEENASSSEVSSETAGDTSQDLQQEDNDALPTATPAAVASPLQSAEIIFSGGEGTADEPYSIQTVADLKKLAADVNSGKAYSGVHFRLDADLDLNGEKWVPIGGTGQQYINDFPGLNGTAYPFKGVFDGGNHTIKNLNVIYGGSNVTLPAADFKGLFGAIDDATIVNLTIEGATIIGGSALGVLVGYAQGEAILQNNKSINSSVTGSGSENLAVGGLIGALQSRKDKNLSVKDNVVQNNTIVNKGTYGTTGGLVGKVLAFSPNASTDSDNSTVILSENSVSGGSITATNYYAGGLVGLADSFNTKNYTCTISNCWTDIPVKTTATTSAYYVGGLVGYIIARNDNSNSIYTIEDCYSRGNVSSSQYYVGGLIGFSETTRATTQQTPSKIIIRNSYATGNVSADSTDVGGLIGHIHGGAGNPDDTVIIENCYATGNVSGNGINVGGFIGRPLKNIIIRNCWSTGNVYGNSNATGGFIGRSYGEISSDPVKIFNSWSSGNVVGRGDYVGGFIGYSNYTDINNSYATGSVYSINNSASTGGFIGFFIGSNTVKNSFAAGHVLGSNSKGFSGSSTSATITNSFFDTTTTQKTVSGVSSGVTGKSTTDMTKAETFAVWNIQENSSGTAGGSGNDDNPWYIDEGGTYPYLYYQYDGHSSEETNYNLALVEYDDGGYQPLGKQMDFQLDKDLATTFQVQTAGAARVFFPFAHETTKDELGNYDNLFTVDTIVIPKSFTKTPKTFSLKANTPYSIGSVSQTGIVAFKNLPSAVKSSDRTRYEEGKVDSYTRVGDLITYTIQVTNYSKDYNWTGIVLNDPLPPGLTFVEDSVKVDGVQIPKDDGAIPYYSFDAEKNQLAVYLKDMPRYVPGEIPAKAAVTFQANVNSHAISAFPYEAAADNLRNRGGVTGNLIFTDGEDHGKYTAKFDDRNKDPIPPQFHIIYDGNGGTTPKGEPQQHGTYVFPNETYSILSNDAVGLEKENAAFTGWNTQADGKGTPYRADDKLALSQDLTLYAQWKPLPSLSFYKVDGNSLSGSTPTFLAGAEFSLYKWNGDSPAGNYPTLEDSNWAFVASTVSSAAQADLGHVKFSNLALSSTYLIIETKSPSGYELPAAQWLFQIDPSAQVKDVALLSGDAQYAVHVDKDKGSFILNYQLPEDYTLPVLGGSGINNFLPIGILLIGAAFLCSGLYLYTNRRKKQRAKGR